MIRFVLRMIGFVLVGAGIIVTPLPIPFGLIMIAMGLVLLIGNSFWVARLVRTARQRWPRFDHSLRQAGSKLPRRLHRILAATDPRRRPKELCT